MFIQLTSFFNCIKLNIIVDSYSDSIYVKHYSCWNLLFTILSNRESFRGVLLYLKVIRLIKFCVEEEKM
ncbi:DUF4372 domain-containing protein [Capnocytophaga genosp. AHN8471]|nr:DUF4372 domain-containing protein [Capnocytophaga genosp. AHN8471]MBM0657272.1 DUF4372 domain-containing protein [Capnocytophaga genosp. AHN8471]